MRPLLLLTALLIGCGTTDPTPFGLKFATDGPVFESGGPITVALTNGTDDEVGYNFCQRHWERKVGAGWEKIEEPLVCTREFTSLEAGGTAEATLTVPYVLPLGTYRASMPIQLGDGSVQIRSNEFSVVVYLNR